MQKRTAIAIDVRSGISTVGIILLAFTSLPNMIYYIVACIGFIFMGLGLGFLLLRAIYCCI